MIHVATGTVFECLCALKVWLHHHHYKPAFFFFSTILKSILGIHKELEIAKVSSPDFRFPVCSLVAWEGGGGAYSSSAPKRKS